MEKEISSGAMLGIVLIALAAVIGLGFGVFSIAKGTANEGVVNMQDSLLAVGQSHFLDYDQKVVSGTQVLSALKGFEGKAVSILIGTKAFNANQRISSSDDHPEAVLAKSSFGYFINYNALLSVDESAKIGQGITGGTTKNDYKSLTKFGGTGTSNITTITLKNGSYETDFGYATVDGTVQFDNSTGGLYKSGNAEYVPSNGKFQANLIKDSSGTTIGITFKQL